MNGRTPSRMLQYAAEALPDNVEAVSEPVALSEGARGLVVLWTQPRRGTRAPALTLMRETASGVTRSFTLFPREVEALADFLGRTDG